MSETLNEFDPVLFSVEENEWLLENLDKPPIVAMKSTAPGVNPLQVRPLLDRIQELQQIEKHEGTEWVGIEAIKDAIRTYLVQDAKWQADHRRNKRAPRFPSLYSFDSKGRAHLGGPGSDSGQVRSYFKPDGTRVPFAIPLVKDDIPDWLPPGFGTDGGTEKTEVGLVVNADLHRIECFCGHTESFKEGSRSSQNAARARMSKHLRKATDEVDRHRELHTNEFGG